MQVDEQNDEFRKFRVGLEMQEAVRRVSRKLSAANDSNLLQAGKLFPYVRIYIYIYMYIYISAANYFEKLITINLRLRIFNL